MFLISCQIIEGMAKVGSTNMEFAQKSVSAIITGVHFPSLGEDDILRTALLLKFEDDSLVKRIASEKLEKQLIEIFNE